MGWRITHGMLLQQPWARLAAEGVFPVLVRSSPTRVRGKVAIVARGYDQNALIDGKPLDKREFPQPRILGYVEIVACVRIPLRHAMIELRRRFGRDFARFYPRHYIPNASPVYFWLLKDPQMLKKPRRCDPKGARKWVRLATGKAP